MDYYQTMRNDYIHKAMYGEDPMRVDFIPKGPSQGTLTIKPKDRCPPRFVTKIEGNAVEEGCKVFFEGIVDAQPSPKFNWYFNDEPILPGQKGFEEAEIHNSRKMSTLILKYAREHHMGKYTVVASNQLGSVECNCDLIVRKKQFPPVFWQRLYNVGSEDARRFVGEVEVGGWPVPEVYWYKVLEDGSEEEVTSRTHTENWNGNPNKYVPSSSVEIKQVDQIRHRILFHHVSEGDSGLYRVRAVNCLGEAECEAQLQFDGCGDGDGRDMYLPPLWIQKKRLNWNDEDQRKKPFSGVSDPELSPEEIAAMKNKSGMVPLSRITEYFASLPDYAPCTRFQVMEKMPFQPGVDERDYRADRRGGSSIFPTKFQKGKISHKGYKTDSIGRILPWWYNKEDPKARDSSDWKWTSVQPNLFVPEISPRTKSPTPTPVWENVEDIETLIMYLRSMGCNVEMVNTDSYQKRMNNKTEAQHALNVGRVSHKENKLDTSSVQEMLNKTEEKHALNVERVSHKENKLDTSSYEESNFNKESRVVISSSFSSQKNNELETHNRYKRQVTETENVVSEAWKQDTNRQTTNTVDLTCDVDKPIYKKEDNLSFPEIGQANKQPPPALPPKTKIRNSPSRNIFSPTESIESNGTGSGTASVRTVEFIPVKEKVKLIAAQQEEILRKEEALSKSGEETIKHKGVRILPPSPVTVRKMSVEDELHNYDSVVTRTTPTTHLLESSTIHGLTESASLIDNKANNSTRTIEVNNINKGSSSTITNLEQEICNFTNEEINFSGSLKQNEEVITSTTFCAFDEQQNYQNSSIAFEQKFSVIDKSSDVQEREKDQFQDILERSDMKYQVDKTLDQLVSHSESFVSNKNIMFEESCAVSETVQSSSASKQMSSLDIARESFSTAVNNQGIYESSAEECRRSFEEAELEAMALDTCALSKQSSIVESSMMDTASVQSFVFQKNTETHNTKMEKQEYQTTESANTYNSRKPQRSESFVRTPDTFTKTAPTFSAPVTPLSQRRRLKINQSPKLPEGGQGDPKYREGVSNPFQPGFYRKPPEDPVNIPNFFSLMRRNNSKSNLAPGKDCTSVKESAINRVSEASSHAYDGDSES